jgi:hypothetical protein
MADFNFITIPELREGLQADYKEIRDCLDIGAWKAVHVLAGSVIEAILLDALSVAPGANTTKLEKMMLAELVDEARSSDIITDDTRSLSTVVRGYRNLIHPGVVKRKEKSVDRSGATVAAELVEMIVKEVAKYKEHTCGFTAPQLLKRLSGGVSAFPLLTHFVQQTHKSELETLLITLLPDAILAESSIDWDDTTRHLITCYHKVFEMVTPDTRRRVVADIYKLFRVTDEATVIFYENYFLRKFHFECFDESELGFVKAHLLPRLGTTSILEHATSGIARLLTDDEITELCTRCARVLARTEKRETQNGLRTTVSAVFYAIEPHREELVRAALREIVDSEVYPAERTAVVTELIESLDDVPF